LGGNKVGFIGENLGRAKRLRFFFFFFPHGFVFNYRVSIRIRSG
jgi:hypothetical protein